jgi:tryptophan synthase alpha chain
VSNGQQAAEVAGYADGVIVGSALVRCLLDAPSESVGAAAVGKLTAELAAGVRAGS